MSPPSLLLLTPLAVVYLFQTVRLGNLGLSTRRRVGVDSLNYWTWLFFLPILLAALSPQALPDMEPIIRWTRTHLVAIVVTMLIVGEILYRIAVTAGIVRLTQIVETTQNPNELKEATEALEALGLFDTVIAGLDRLTAMVPDPSKVYSALASLYGIQRRFLRAEEAARRAIALDPTNPFGHYYLGMAAIEFGRADEAAECFSKARQFGLALPDIYFPKPKGNHGAVR